jgi:hypothetical protein
MEKVGYSRTVLDFIVTVTQCVLTSKRPWCCQLSRIREPLACMRAKVNIFVIRRQRAFFNAVFLSAGKPYIPTNSIE